MGNVTGPDFTSLVTVILSRPQVVDCAIVIRMSDGSLQVTSDARHDPNPLLSDAVELLTPAKAAG